ncbi:MAG: hypothetical protein U5K69_00205 [Balneolaceae bacterium]|nr:hypothetical protein [Balneolaceae bacterium]
MSAARGMRPCSMLFIQINNFQGIVLAANPGVSSRSLIRALMRSAPSHGIIDIHVGFIVKKVAVLFSQELHKVLDHPQGSLRSCETV